VLFVCAYCVVVWGKEALKSSIAISPLVGVDVRSYLSRNLAYAAVFSLIPA
jgi:hypothetical protein